MVIGGGAGAWWFYIAVAMAPMIAISRQYIMVGSIKISISSTLLTSLMNLYYDVFVLVDHTGIAVGIAFFSAVT